jgi:MFS family permease
VAELAWTSRTFESVHRYRNYRLYVYGQLVSLTGQWMQDTTLPWVVLQQTGSAVDVGVLVVFRYGPYFFLGLPAGLLADRFDNRRMMIGAQVAMMLAAGALAVLEFIGTPPLWAIYVLAGIGGIGIVIDAPNRHALVYQLVGPRQLANAIALNSSIMSSARTIGPAVGGVLIAVVGAAWCFAYNTASFLAILIALLLISPAEMFPVKRLETSENGARSIWEGLTFSLRSPPIRVVLIMGAIIALVGFNFRVLVPVLAKDTLHQGALVFGILSACFGVGSIVGGLAAATYARASWKPVILGSFVAAASVLLIALVPVTPVVAILLLASGAGYTVWLAGGQSIVQLRTPDEMRGRVMSIYLFVLAGFLPISGLIGGVISDATGPRIAFLIAGLAGLSATAVVLLFGRPVRLQVTGSGGGSPNPQRS